MIVKETNLGNDYLVEIFSSLRKGDRARMFERNRNHDDVPLVIVYNLGSDFALRTEEEQKMRVMSMLKMLRAGVNEVMEDIGSLVGAHPPQIQPHEMGESGGPGIGGGGMQ